MPSNVARPASERRRPSATAVRFGLDAERLVDQVAILVWRLWRRASSRAAAAGHVLVAGPGGGSIGDEAMYESFAAEVDGALTVIVRAEGDLLLDPATYGGRAVHLPGLLYGGIRGHFRAMLRFLHLLDGAESLSVVGADTMDGVYGVRPSVRRFRLSAIAAQIGIPSRVLGFSWNASPAPEAIRQLRRTPAAVVLLARDPVSAGRLRADGAATVVEAADLAFLIPSSDEPVDEVDAWIERQRAQHRDVVLVNANPWHRKRFDGHDEAYQRLVDDLVSSGRSCVVLANDSRNGDDSEVAYLRGLFAGSLQRDEVFVVDRVYLPGQVARIASQCVLGVSGRMHVVILAAAAGTPAIGLDYQGKFEGLYQLLGYDLRVKSGSLTDSLSDHVRLTLDRAPALRHALSETLPAIKTRARLNIPGADTEGPT